MGTHHKFCRHPGTFGALGIYYHMPWKKGNALITTGGGRSGSAQLGGLGRGVASLNRLTRAFKDCGETNKW